MAKDFLKLLCEGLSFPEGPLFDRDGNLWCVELKGNVLGCWNGESYRRVSTGGGEPNGLAMDGKGRIYVCDTGKQSIRRYDPSAGDWETLVDSLDGQPLGKPNDLAFDNGGNLLFTCPNDGRTEPDGYLCAIRPDRSVKLVKDGMYFCNGLAFTSDGKTLIVAETYRQRLWKGQWDSDEAAWINPEPWADVGGPIGPDGFAFGADGLLYVAVYGSKQIKIINPDGDIVDALPLPGSNPTNCAFDPLGRWGLVVTEAEKGLLVSFPQLGPGINLFDGAEAWK